ncbi:bifunctional phosphoribosylaminoimidazolecarboxamide formyltransferase/IMP cyclohydrolase [Christensenellaceae bacterium NSJ-44]|uniref:Bifunctional purine biosynthesis protein PurH n=1 Tax=Luoshenia tenuis TaxID=2763654 RepID=A0A926CZF5_9FIRM|nr:bifunctional phosphoribosylaminoimidazolecarboxamide formyltransferase/IMP cyclohydrolase [Luoshenia tenuis]MBC8528938.1 bifunctional phosphoribosylaminoimidazolecarboxamide formyltransferase/IMP cyclohydrolase [Luoshenia tenuis]
MVKRALISVSDKTGIVELAKSLHDLGIEILSTGGTAKTIAEAGIPVTNVSDVTGFPECLDGRVKTLHPSIHAGLLAMRGNPEHMRQIEELGIEPIDLVAINLYPFKQTIQKPGVTREEAIENIDIGGPTMIRAAAKNWQDVAVMVDPADYAGVLDEIRQNGEVCLETKLRLCYKVFEHTASYDTLISTYLREQVGITFPETLSLTFEKAQDMRYGENPHQNAVFYKEIGKRPGTLADAKQLHGKELSYNNINDTNGALDLLREFSDTTVVAVKHANPCGVASADTVYEAYKAAYEADPVSIFGGIVVTNAQVDEDTAKEMAKIFLEIIVAPSFTPEALAVLTKKKNIRLLELASINQPLAQPAWDMKKVAGGLLVQEMDLKLLGDELKVVTKRQPTEKEMQDMIFAWKLVKHTKSNGIAIAKDGHSLGIGPGQVNRIWAVEQSIERSGEAVKGAALASDAFFPFDDCVKAAAAAGITAIIQPGGSIRDEDSIKACDEAGIAMVFTGMRHFKH